MGSRARARTEGGTEMCDLAEARPRRRTARRDCPPVLWRRTSQGMNPRPASVPHIKVDTRLATCEDLPPPSMGAFDKR
jgi:hypothetical protein